MRPKRIIRASSAVALLSVIGLSLLALFPGAIVIEETVGEASVFIRAERRWVVNAGDSVRVQWAMGNVNAVFVAGDGEAGTGAADFVVSTEREIRVEVHLRDGSVQPYTLVISTMALAPEVWVLVLVALVAACLALLQVLLIATRPHHALLQRALQWGGLVFVSLALTLLVLEWGLRWHFAHNGTQAEQIRYLYDSQAIQAHYNRQQLRLPYLGDYSVASDYNALGYRNAEAITLPKPADVYRIVAVGDSSTVGTFLNRNETYVAQLQAALRDQYNTDNIEVINGAHNGYNSWDGVVNLAFRLSELEPDLVLIYHSWLDLTERLVPPACYRNLSVYRGLPARHTMERPVILPDSALLRYAGIRLGHLPDPTDYAARTQLINLCDAAIAEPDLAWLQENPPVYFRRNLATMIDIGRGMGAEVMLSTWAYQMADSSAAPEERAALDEHNAAIRALAAERDTLFYDLAATDLPHDPANWADEQHQSARGARLQAQYYAAYLAEQFPTLPPARRD